MVLNIPLWLLVIIVVIIIVIFLLSKCKSQGDYDFGTGFIILFILGCAFFVIIGILLGKFVL